MYTYNAKNVPSPEIQRTVFVLFAKILHLSDIAACDIGQYTLFVIGLHSSYSHSRSINEARSNLRPSPTSHSFTSNAATVELGHNGQLKATMLARDSQVSGRTRSRTRVSSLAQIPKGKCRNGKLVEFNTTVHVLLEALVYTKTV